MQVFGLAGGSSDPPNRWTFGFIDTSVFGSRVWPSGHTDSVVFGSHRLPTSVDSYRSELGPRPGTERTRVPRGQRLRSKLPRDLLVSEVLFLYRFVNRFAPNTAKSVHKTILTGRGFASVNLIRAGEQNPFTEAASLAYPRYRDRSSMNLVGLRRT